MTSVDLKARYAEPDAEAFLFFGSDWSRTLARVCPWCHATFWTFAPMPLPEGAFWTPFTIQPEPPYGKGQRQTCGDPDCYDAEQTHQWRRRLDDRAGYVPKAPAASTPLQPR